MAIVEKPLMEEIHKFCGIYVIKNLATNKVYIGSSNDIFSRFKGHINLLVKNKHHSILLQRTWNRYGYDYFDFDIVEECEKKDLLTKEQYYLDLYKSYDPEFGYNISKDAIAPTKGRKLNLSDERKEQLRKQMLGNKITLGYHHTDDTKLKMSRTRKGKKRNEEIFKKIWKTRTKTWPGLISPTGEIYLEITNLKRFCEEHSLSSGNIQGVYAGNRKQCKGWKRLENAIN